MRNKIIMLMLATFLALPVAYAGDDQPIHGWFTGPNSRTVDYAADTASNDTYVITLSPAPGSYTAGMVIAFLATTANTGACTINVNGLGAKNLKMLNNQDPGNDYIEAASIVVAVYDGTSFQIISPDNNP